LQEAGAALLPGTAFGAPADHLTARLAFVDFDGAVLLQVAADPDLTNEELLLHSALQDMRAGIDAIGRWLEH
jgi:aspartate aminotransferase